MKFKFQMEEVRKNPQIYFNHNIGVFLNSPETLATIDYLCLLFSATSFEYKEHYEKINQVLSKTDWSKEDPILHYFYLTISGVKMRSIYNAPEAFNFFIESYNLALIINDYELIARSLIYIASAYNQLNQYENSLEYAEKAVHLISRLSNTLIICDIYMTLGTVLLKLDRYYESYKFYKIAEEYYNGVTDKEKYFNYMILLMNISEVCQCLNLDKSSTSYSAFTLELIEKNDFALYLQNSALLINEFYKKNNQPDKANQILAYYYKVFTDEICQKNNIINSKNAVKDFFNLDSMHKLQALNDQLNSQVALLNDIVLLNRPISTNLNDKLQEIIEAIPNNEFIPFYQAKWSIKNQSILGAEMLIRWKKSNGTIISPSEFIDIIENKSIMIEISEMLIGQAIKDLSSIIKYFPDFKLSINVSPYQLLNQDLPKLLESLCLIYNVPNGSIEIEIVERTIIDDNDTALEKLNRLKDKGFIIVLDDFGAGYSSLSLLNDFPIDIVKIDRSLVNTIDKNSKAKVLFSSLVSILNDLGIRTVAEGIETYEQLKIVQKTLCDEGQGFLIHKPCCANDFRLTLNKIL
ncbi:EAL domain-containing protein [Acetoanaerobium sticklandii]|uniref:EAL domain-containing protein n=1 Tax=Acetoanaerobium sticklandii TaxID=1511 RepID=UPI003A91A9EF